ncbi:MAG: site-2 protease family protein, partial [Thermomicrobiaceae bacterium]|nr:site-2 protease family protein [Thermomicrobiaceae bacterium]
LYRIDGHPIWLVLAYIGVLLNLFNLLPVLPLDGGRAVSAISRWMWAVGIVGLIALMLARPNPVLVVIALFAGGELLQARRRQDIAPDYYRVPLRQRLAVSVVYFGLIVTLGVSLLQLEPLVHAGRPL